MTKINVDLGGTLTNAPIGSRSRREQRESRREQRRAPPPTGRQVLLRLRGAQRQVAGDERGGQRMVEREARRGRATAARASPVQRALAVRGLLVVPGFPCGCPWRTCPTRPTRTSGAACGRLRGVTAKRSRPTRPAGTEARPRPGVRRPLSSHDACNPGASRPRSGPGSSV